MPTRFVRNLFSACCALSLSTLFACAQEGESVIVLGAPVFDAASGEFESFGCGATAGGSNFLAGMSIDVSVDTGLIIPLEVQNNILATSPGTTQGGIDQGEIRIESVEVDIRFPQLPELEAEVRADSEQYLHFTLPLPSDSIASSGGRKVFMAIIPDNIILRQRAMLEKAGLTNGATVLAMYTFKFHAHRATAPVLGFGEIDVREYTMPVQTGYNNLRTCQSTVWQLEEGTPIYELCSPANCASPQVYRGSICGNAQFTQQTPMCCDGPDNWTAITNAADICGVAP